MPYPFPPYVYGNPAAMGGGILPYSDTFTGTDGTGLASHAPDAGGRGGYTVAGSGTVQLSGNKLRKTGGAAAYGWAWIDLGVTDVTITGTLTADSAQRPGVILRVIDENNHVMAWYNRSAAALQIWRVANGVYSQHGSDVAITLTAGQSYAFTATITASTVTFTVNGTSVTVETISDYGPTKHGFVFYDAPSTGGSGIDTVAGVAAAIPEDPPFSAKRLGLFNPNSISGSDGDLVASLSTLTASGSDRPTLRLAALNGRKALEFSGSNELYDSSWSSTMPHAVFALVRPTAAGKYVLDATGTSNRFRLYDDNSSNPAWTFVGATATKSVPWVCQNEWQLVHAMTNANVGIDGYEQGSSATASTGTWAGLRLGRDKDGANGFTGKIAHVAVYASTLTAAERVCVLLWYEAAFGTTRLPWYAARKQYAAANAITLSGAGDATGVFVSGGTARLRQKGLASPVTYAFVTPQTWTGLEITATFRVISGPPQGAAGPFTSEESAHGGIGLGPDINNFYMLMISPAASQATPQQRDIQLVKVVAGVETLLATAMSTATLQFGTDYTLKAKKVGNTVTGRVYTTGGTLLGTVSVDDTDITTGGAILHGYAVDYSGIITAEDAP